MSKWIRVVSIIIPLLVIMIGLGALLLWSCQSERFPLRVVEVHAELKHIKEDDIKAAVLPYLNQGFFWLSVRTVSESVKHLPWVQSVEVRRIWPDRVAIYVEEQKAQARWGDKGVLSTDGRIFFPDPLTISDKLPRFNGPLDRAKEMQQQYLAILELLGPIGLTVEELSLASNGSWQMRLNNELKVVLGKAALNERMTRFALAYQCHLQAQSKRIAYVDLRYTNGFAIGWENGCPITSEVLTNNAQESR